MSSFSLLFLIIFFLCYSSCTVKSHESHGHAKKPYSIFILGGQSNMAGRGGVVGFTKWDGVVLPRSEPNPKILRLNRGLKWEEAREPLHVDIDVGKPAGIGPGMSFAHSCLERDWTIGVIGLVPCAVGGTGMSQWARGGKLYNQLVNRTKAAMNDVAAGGKVRAMLWYQGEQDSDDAKSAKLYKRRLERFFNNVRSDLNLPNLRIIQVAIATGGKYKKDIRKAQLSLNLPNVTTIDAEGLEVLYDHLHLTAESQDQLGEVLADRFLGI